MFGRLSFSSSSRNPHVSLVAACAAPGHSLLAQFSYLQLLDLLTTVAFLTTGVHEANPVVRLAIAVAPSPLIGLLALKICALAAAVYCAATGRGRLLGRMNLLFAALIVWNLIAIMGR